MLIISHGIRLNSLVLFLLLVYHGHTFSLNDFSLSSSSCQNISISNVSFGRIHSLNFFAGQSQPPNVTCSWTISNVQTSIWSNYILSVRVIELENDPTHWSNELSLWTGNRQISFDDINKRTYLISTPSSLQIFFRTKAPLLQTYNPYIRTNLRIRRFLIEFMHMNHDSINLDTNHYFRCVSSGILIPKQWRCNCIYECSYGNHSDEDNCPLCSMYEPSTSLLCQSDEMWCLPSLSTIQDDNQLIDQSEEDVWMQTHRSYSRRIDPKGVCISRNDSQKCAYSTNNSNCQTVLAWRRDQGQILLDNDTLNKYQTLCFVIIAKEDYKIKLLLNQYQIIGQRPDLEWIIYDGSEDQNQILVSSNHFLMKEIVQTRDHHIATIIIRQRFLHSTDDNTVHSYVDEDVLGHFEMNETRKSVQRRDINSMLLNITWFTSICPDDQTLCGGHLETKCYTVEQRCNGIWDCISGDDELGCSPESCPTTFACNDRLRLPSDQPRCFTWSERCNGNAFCANRTDEKFCTHWWCNSNNGTFLCKNLNCIYETWVCDGTDDCGDRSDEISCPSRVPRRIVTAAVIGATVCSTLFIIALGCTCKLFHLRTSERRAASRLLNPQRYIEQRRQQLQREQQRRSNRRNRPQPSVPVEPSTIISSDTRRLAPPSYNQTMGLMDENEERQAALAEHLRLAGLANFISLPPIQSSSRSSRSTSRHRHRRHRRHRHHHHYRRAHSEGSRVALLEPAVVVPSTAFPQPSTTISLSRFNRLRSQLQSLFSTNSLPPAVTQAEHRERRQRSRPPSVQPIVLTTRSCPTSDFLHPREPPPPYSEEQSIDSHPSNSTSITTVNTNRRPSNDASDPDLANPTSDSTSSYRLHKRQIPLNTLRDRMRQFISGSSMRSSTDDLSHPMEPTALMSTTTTSTTLNSTFEPTTPPTSVGDDEQPTSEEDKILTP